MRLRWQRRLIKWLRTRHNRGSRLRASLTRLEQQGFRLEEALGAAVLDRSLVHQDRAAAAEFLSRIGDSGSVQSLITLFFEQTQKDDLFDTALTIEGLNDRRAIPHLIRGLLKDSNADRRRAAARALGWIHPSNGSAARALAECVCDVSQTLAVREEAAESLAYVGTYQTIDPLISVMRRDPEAGVRFWAVFGLGGSGRGEARVEAALESMLTDTESPAGEWWPVGMEALAMLGAGRLSQNRYRALFIRELQRIQSDPDRATEGDRRWASFYGLRTACVESDSVYRGYG